MALAAKARIVDGAIMPDAGDDILKDAPLRDELRLILGDGVNQAADLASGATSIPSRNLTPWMTFGNWF
jgi:hypothetical protein